MIIILLSFKSIHNVFLKLINLKTVDKANVFFCIKKDIGSSTSTSKSNQTSNRKYLLKLIKRRAKVRYRNISHEDALNFDQ